MGWGQWEQCSLFQLKVRNPQTSEAQLPAHNTNSLWQAPFPRGRGGQDLSFQYI